MRVPAECFRKGRGNKGTMSRMSRVGAFLKLFGSQVMKVLLRNHGLNLSGVKSDLYTGIRA